MTPASAQLDVNNTSNVIVDWSFINNQRQKYQS